MKKALLSKLFQCLLLCMLFLTMIPTRLLAEGEGAYAYSKSGGGKTYYYSLNDAMNASRSGLTIVMAKDWELTSSLNIVEGTTSRIEMNGHVIKRVDTCVNFCSDKEVITMHPNSKLYLYGDLNKEAEYTFNFRQGGLKNIYKTETSGGFIGNGRDTGGNGFYMKKGAKLYMDNVTICGHFASNGAGIYINGEDCEVHMSNGSKISYNISSNGGGIYSNDDGTKIFMNSDSKIYKNEASNGGGIYFNYSWFSIEGDGTGLISENDVTGGKGGGICVNSRTFGSNSSTISGITVQSNVAKYGGGIYLDQHYTTVDNCKIYGNDASCDGGGIYNNGKNTIKDSEIKGNRCNLFPDTDTNYEGGGIFASSNYDLTFKGKLIIKENKRKNPDKSCYWCYPGMVFNPDRAGYTYDDVFLNSATYNAYILADNINPDSQIGIRTANSKDRLIVKNLATYDYGYTFFMNLGETYHIGFESKDKQLWQRLGATSYIVRVDGKEQGRYTSGTKNVTVVANNSDPNKAFDSWSSNDTISLSDEQLSSRTISFTMPSMEVDFKTNYIEAAKDISLKVNELTVNGTFPSKAALVWTNDVSTCSKQVDITWYKNTDNGYQKVMSSDTVQEGVAYFFTTTIKKKVDNTLRIAFSDSLEKKDVTIKYGDNKTIDIASFSLNDEGTLSLSTDNIIVGKDKLSYAVPIVVSVKEGITKSDLIDLINSNKQTKVFSSNYNEYDVNISDINESALNGLAFTYDFKLVRPLDEKTYYRIDNIPLNQSSLDINYNGVTTTSIIINVSLNSTEENVYKISDTDRQDDTYWYKTFSDADAYYYSIDDVLGITKCDSNPCSYTLTGVKGQRKEYSVDIYTVDNYTYQPVFSETRKYILDDFKLNAPVFNEEIESSDDTGKSLSISAYSNAGTIYYLYNDGTNNWNISDESSITLKNSENAYKTYRVLSWASDNKLVSEVSSKDYVIDNSKEIVYVNQIDITMNWPTIGEKFPTKIDSIKAQLMERTVDIASDLSITSWDPEIESDVVEYDNFYLANIKLDGLSDDQINLMKNYDIKVNDTNRSYSYLTYENDANWLHIIFYGANGFGNVYNDKVLSYTIKNITVADYGSISYEEAKQLNNDIKQYNLPSYALLQAIDDNDNSETYITADITWNTYFTNAFDSSNTKAQAIVIKGQINLPSYVSNPNNVDTNVALTINVEPKKIEQTSLSSTEDVINKLILSDEEKKQIANEATVDVNLLVSNYVNKEDKELINNKLGNYKLGQTLDLTLIKTITYNETSTETKVDETSGDIEVTITITDALINKAEGIDRTYKVLRVHDNKVDTLDASFNPVNKTITFKTNKFSTYALVYKDTIRDNNTGSSLTCEEYMGSNDWTWSETKKACVYRVSNTSVK